MLGQAEVDPFFHQILSEGRGLSCILRPRPVNRSYARNRATRRRMVSNTDMRSFCSVMLLAAISKLAVAQNAPTPNSDVQTNWQAIDQLCGQLELSTPKQKRVIVDGKSEVRLYTAFLEGATLTLYRRTSTEQECCSVKAIATTQSHRFGTFEFDEVQRGAYWLRVQKHEFVGLIPVRVTDNLDAEQCKKSEVSRSFVVDSSPPKVQKRIR